MSKTLASELGRDQILINVIGPGRIGTARIASLNAMRAKKAGITVEEYEKRDLEAFPLGRYGNTDGVWTAGCVPLLRGQQLYFRTDNSVRRRHDQGLLMEVSLCKKRPLRLLHKNAQAFVQEQKTPVQLADLYLPRSRGRSGRAEGQGRAEGFLRKSG